MGKGRNIAKKKASRSSSVDDEKLIKKNKKKPVVKKKQKISRSPSPQNEYETPKFKNYIDYEDIKTTKFKNLDEKYIKIGENLADFKHEEVLKYWETSEAKEISKENKASIGDLVNHIIKERALRTTLRNKQNEQKKHKYNLAQMTKFVQLCNEYEDKYTMKDLKEILKLNDQSSSGNKPELVERVADGQVLGKIPRCNFCFGGKPRFNYLTGDYICAGYRNDDEYLFCNKTYSFDSLPREPWITKTGN